MIRQLRRSLGVLALALALLGALANSAFAHPLGNFTVNHLSIVSVRVDGVHVRYILDLAEIPTLQEASSGRSSTVVATSAAALELRIGGELVPLRVDSSTVERLPGQAGLDTLRVTIDASAAASVRDGVRIAYRDQTFPGRIGWHDVVLRGAISDANASADDPTNELRSYPADATVAPADRLEAQATAAIGANIGSSGAPASDTSRFALDVSADRLTGFLRTGPADLVALVAALCVAMFLGALHALGPGHGKAMVAAYLVGSKGSARDAVILGGTVTITHTLGVYALGLVTLVAAQFLLPEKLYPIIGVISGALVVLIGLGLLRARLGRASRGPGRIGDGDHADHHEHAHGEGPGLHRHDGPVGLKALLALGVSGGLLPCPTALVVLLAAVSFHNLLLGMVLVVAFSVGLAAVLMGIGLALVAGQGVLRRSAAATRVARSRLAVTTARYLPAGSAAAITIAGLIITVSAAKGLS